MHACMHVSMYGCMHVWMHACTDACVFLCMNACMHACKHMSMYAFYVCMHECMDACMYGCWCEWICLFSNLHQHHVVKLNGQSWRLFENMRGKCCSTHPSFSTDLAPRSASIWSRSVLAGQHGQPIGIPCPPSFPSTWKSWCIGSVHFKSILISGLWYHINMYNYELGAQLNPWSNQGTWDYLSISHWHTAPGTPVLRMHSTYRIICGLLENPLFT